MGGLLIVFNATLKKNGSIIISKMIKTYIYTNVVCSQRIRFIIVFYENIFAIFVLFG